MGRAFLSGIILTLGVFIAFAIAFITWDGYHILVVLGVTVVLTASVWIYRPRPARKRSSESREDPEWVKNEG